VERSAAVAVITDLGRLAVFIGLNLWIEAGRFGMDVQHVLALRMLRLASGGPLATREASRMVTEKIAAFGQAQTAALSALGAGFGPERAAAQIYGPYRRTVRANRRRLGA
jgi:hypothetical protein